MPRHLARMISPVVEHLESQPQQTVEYLLMVTVYVLFIVLLSLALWFRGTTFSASIIAVILVMVVAEAIYVLYFKYGTSMCDICSEMACGTVSRQQ